MRVVQKYGGTSVGSVERIRAVAQRCLATQRRGHEVVVIVSAMAGETNRLLARARAIAPEPDERECGVIAATGEQVSVGLLALAIQALGGKAQSFLGHQVRVLTDSAFARARIRDVDGARITRALSEGTIAIVAGFQGTDEHGNITTLGRGGSDTSGVAVAAALKADVCEIYTDVDGVYTADPSVCPDARKIERISDEEMLELASLGAKVLQIRSVELGMKHGVRIHVRSSFNDNPGTWVVPEEGPMEEVLVAGVTCARDEAKITVLDVPDLPGVAAAMFKPLAEVGVVVDTLVQNLGADGRADVTFTVPRGDLKRAVATLKAECRDLVKGGVQADDSYAKVSVVGVGMRSHAGVATRMFELLAAEGINIAMISTSEIKISCVIEAKYAELAVRILHAGFGLGQPPAGTRPKAARPRRATPRARSRAPR
ncbi:MAG: aspartate kinase [Deltaproteobacteria bacterium]|nr:aspartate kinase [Deltaproteobacteria bacterium]